MKRYNIQENIGSSKYVVNFHDGVKAHGDGSAFFDVRIFSSRVKMDSFVRSLVGDGYFGSLRSVGGLD